MSYKRDWKYRWAHYFILIYKALCPSLKQSCARLYCPNGKNEWWVQGMGKCTLPWSTLDRCDHGRWKRDFLPLVREDGNYLLEVLLWKVLCRVCLQCLFHRHNLSPWFCSCLQLEISSHGYKWAHSPKGADDHISNGPRVQAGKVHFFLQPFGIRTLKLEVSPITI